VLVSLTRARADLQFNTYDPARIKSHPGVSTELSPVSPQDTLVTDFFGGVANVEIQGSEAKLTLRSAPSEWVQAKRPRANIRTISHSGSAKKKKKGHSRPLEQDEGKGWHRPLERGTTVVSGMVGSAALLGLAGLLVSRAISIYT
jgi:phosphatidylinositol glycan class K